MQSEIYLKDYLELDAYATELATRNFEDYFKLSWEIIEPGTPLLWNWHHSLICEYLTACHLSQIKRLVINIPPRYSKSNLATVSFPTWLWIKNPRERFLFASHDASLSTLHSVNRRRIIESEWYQAKWGHKFKLTGDQNVKTSYENTEKGRMTSTSMQGSAIGKGGNCIAEGQRVLTKNGLIPIENIKVGDYVFTHKKRWKKVIAVKFNGYQKVFKMCVNGGSIVCTNDHKFYTENGWEYAKLCKKVYFCNMPLLQQLFLCKRSKKKPSFAKILQFKMFKILSKRFVGKKKTYLQKLQKNYSRSTCKNILLKKMYVYLCKKNKHLEKIISNSMQLLQEKVFSKKQFYKILWVKVQKQGTFFKNKRKSKSKLERRSTFTEKQSKFQRKIVTLFKEKIKLSKLQFIYTYMRSSYRRKSKKRQFKKLNCFMPFMPQQISSYKQYDEKKVYDIQVEKDSSFICEGFIVHNCIIIDDPHDPKKAESEVQRVSVIKSISEKFTTRLDDKKNGVMIMIMQRVHYEDATQYALDNGWEHLNVPAIAPDKKVYIFPISKQAITREKGQALHPEREDVKDLEKQKREMGSYAFSAQYLQEPTPRGGGFIKSKYFNVVDEMPGKFDEVIQFWDMAMKDPKESIDASKRSKVAGGVFGRIGQKKYVLYMTSKPRTFTQSLLAVLNTRAMFPKSYRILVEDKANGSAVVSVLKKKISGIMEWPIGTKSKIERFFVIEPDFEAGNWHIPNKKNAAWVDDFIDELEKFPKGQHDDQVDCWTGAGNYFIQKTSNIDQLIKM